MKRRSGRNPINFVHAIHICNFVFAIQSRRHATRNRFPLDSSNGYVYFSLLSPASASSTVSSATPSPFFPPFSPLTHPPFHVRWQPIFIPVIAFAIPMRERERDSTVSALGATSLHDSLEYLFTPSNEEYLSIPRCISSCSFLVFPFLFFSFSNGNTDTIT